MQRAGLIGYPVGHSVSPALHNAAFRRLGIDARYELWETPPEALGERVAALREPDVLGANVTIPHKEAALHLLDEVRGVAVVIGAVNTIVRVGERLHGYNTDVAGFQQSLAMDARFEAKGAKAVVLGAGGASRAVGLALLCAGARSVTFTDIAIERAEAVASLLAARTSEGNVSACLANGESANDTILECDLLVNCTPMGMAGAATVGKSPLTEDAIPRGIQVFDIVFNPPETPLLAAAKRRGCRTQSGLGMLVRQAAESFRLWTGTEAPLDVMMRAGEAAIVALGG